jgi:hypothetical protein
MIRQQQRIIVHLFARTYKGRKRKASSEWMKEEDREGKRCRPSNKSARFIREKRGWRRGVHRVQGMG